MTVISGTEELTEDPYALTFIVKDTKDFTITELCYAAATMVANYTPLDKDYNAEWSQWNAGRFRKLLKRLKPKEFDKLPAVLEEENVEYYVETFDMVELLMIAPKPKSFSLPLLKRAQVSHLTTVVKDSETMYDSDNAIVITVNSGLNMTAGKAACAAAHAAQKAVEVLYGKYLDDYLEWLMDKNIVIQWSNAVSDDSLIAIHDAGLTEVDPGSITATADYDVSV